MLNLDKQYTYIFFQLNAIKTQGEDISDNGAIRATYAVSRCYTRL